MKNNNMKNSTNTFTYADTDSVIVKGHSRVEVAARRFNVAGFALDREEAINATLITGWDVEDCVPVCRALCDMLEHVYDAWHGDGVIGYHYSDNEDAIFADWHAVINDGMYHFSAKAERCAVEGHKNGGWGFSVSAICQHGKRLDESTDSPEMATLFRMQLNRFADRERDAMLKEMYGAIWAESAED